MKDILEYFPLRRYGAIALLFVFPIFSLYYYFAYFPSLNTSPVFQWNCQNPDIGLILSFPKYISDSGEFSLTVQSSSSEPINNLQVIIVLNALENLNSLQKYQGANIVVSDVVFDQLNTGIAENKKVQVSTVNLQNGEHIRIDEIRTNDKKGILTICKDSLLDYYVNDYTVTIYNRFYAWLIFVLTNIPIALSSIFIVSIISCSINDDDNQDFHPTSQAGKYYIAKVVFRASIPLSIIFIILYAVNWSLDIETEIGMGFASDAWAITRIVLIITLLFLSIIANKIISRINTFVNYEVETG